MVNEIKEKYYNQDFDKMELTDDIFEMLKMDFDHWSVKLN